MCSDIFNESTQMSIRTDDFTYSAPMFLKNYKVGEKITAYYFPGKIPKAGFEAEVKYNCCVSQLGQFEEEIDIQYANDAYNDQGLGIGGLEFTPFFPPADPIAKNNISVFGLPLFLAALCKDCNDVKDFVLNKGITVSGWSLAVDMMNAGVHFACHDAKGNSIVVEWIDGKPQVYDNNDYRVMMNQPSVIDFREYLKTLNCVTPYTPSDNKDSNLIGPNVPSGIGAGLKYGPSDIARYTRGYAFNKNITPCPADATLEEKLAYMETLGAKIYSQYNVLTPPSLPPGQLYASQIMIIRSHDLKNPGYWYRTYVQPKWVGFTDMNFMSTSCYMSKWNSDSIKPYNSIKRIA